ncbi:MAG: double-strand break repair protein AddB [Rhodospirillales bacterium]
MTRPRIFTIPPGVSFVDALASQMLRETGSNPLALTRCRILLPTRRACRALALAFLRLRQPLLLPRMSPIGDVDEDELALEYADAVGEDGGFEVAPAITPLRRQLLLTRLILALRGDETSADQAARLAQELARLVDQVRIEECDWRKLASVVPEEFSHHWQITLEFLKIVTEQWPAILAEEGRTDVVERRTLLLSAQAEAWRQAPPLTPVIAAGSTGSVPASAQLMKVVASLPQGAIVLPGLDLDADAETWELIKTEPWHPQFGMSQLLDRLGIDRSDVLPWPHPPLPATPPERSALIARALRPAATSPSSAPISPLAVRDVVQLELQRPEEEARCIALIMRQTLEEPGRTAALVTPDRILARRVAAELQRWEIAIDDSAGIPLGDTPPGAFFRLVASMVAEAFAPVPLLAALKHPLAAGGMAVGRFRSAVRRLERRALRGPRPAPGLAGLRKALADAGGEGSGEGERVVELLARATKPFSELIARDSVDLDHILQMHVAAAEALAATDVAKGADRLWEGDDGDALAEFVAALAEAASGFEFVRPEGYPAFFDTLISGHVVRPRWGRHPRLAIWGPLEARLQHADVMILGGLNEESWPPRVEASPWMSRPMMKAFGLPLPERRLGLSAHDFCQAFSSPQVWLTRSLRKEGSPTVPARWLVKLEAILRGDGGGHSLRGSEQWIVWQAILNKPSDNERRRIAPPAPCPPVAVRPRQLSVTQIETWMRDPYAIYARHILALKALDPVDADPTLADYGNFVHKALELFIHHHPQAMLLDDDEALRLLLACGREAFAPMLERPGVRAFWWPRFNNISRWYVAEERSRQAEVNTRFAELSGSLKIDAPAGKFNLTAKADRIDRLGNGAFALIDYKTGGIPKAKELEQGFAPQLPLEAAIAISDGFPNLAATRGGIRIESLEFWRLCGNAAGGERRISKSDPMDIAETALAGLRDLVATFDRADTAYAARPRPSVAPRFSDYEHLARVKEWSAGPAEANDL